MTKESKLMKNTAIIAIGNLCTKCISFFLLPLYTSLLDPEQYGTVDLVLTYSSLIIIVVTLQFEQGVFRNLIDVRGKIEYQKKYISTSIFSLLFSNVIIGICVGWILTYLKYSYTLYLVILVITGSYLGLLLQIPRGLGDNTIYAIGSCIGGSLNVILNVIFIVYLSLGVNGMLLATTISNLIACIYIFFRIKLYVYLKIRYFDVRTFLIMAKYSFPLIPYTMCWWVINASDRAIINFFLGTSANGIYAVAYKFPSMFSMVSNIFQLAWTESASENVKEEGRDKYYNSVVNRAIRFYSSCNIGIIAVIPFVFNFLIKKDYIQSYNYIPILMTTALFHAVAALYGSIYFAFKETGKVAYTTALSAAINIIVNICLIRQIGLYAAAISSMIAYFVIILIRVFDLRKMVNIHVKTSYLLTELLVYCIIWGGYYSRLFILQVIVLLGLVPYCLVINASTIKSLLKVASARAGRKESPSI